MKVCPCYGLALLTLFLCETPTWAEHRVALLVGNSQYQMPQGAAPQRDLAALAASLQTYGFRCRVLTNLPGKKLKEAVESFTRSTPTRGTSLVYFSGQVLSGTYKSKPGTFLVGTDVKRLQGRDIGYAGYSVETLLDGLSSRGGSSVNLVVIDPAKSLPGNKQQELKENRLPAGCFLASIITETFLKQANRGDLLASLRSGSRWSQSRLPQNATLGGSGSKAIAGPQTFPIGKKAGDEWVNLHGTVFCWCPPGSYLAGSPEDLPGRYPDETQRKVTIARGFWIGKYELTLRENLRNHPRGTIAKHKNHPLTMMHLDDARSMTTRVLTQQERKQGRLPSDWQYSLPTEDQWEYAARAGSTSRFYFGDGLVELPSHANFGDRSYYLSKDIYSNAADRTLDDHHVQLAIVGSYRPNPWGLHDVYGNVAEWCLDRAARGGSWVSVPENCRSAYRDWYSNRNQQNFLGYRLIIQKVPPSAKPGQKTR